MSCSPMVRQNSKKKVTANSIKPTPAGVETIIAVRIHVSRRKFTIFQIAFVHYCLNAEDQVLD